MDYERKYYVHITKANKLAQKQNMNKKKKEKDKIIAIAKQRKQHGITDTLMCQF